MELKRAVITGLGVVAVDITDRKRMEEGQLALTRNGGSMADAGSVSYMFARKGVVIVPKASLPWALLLVAALLIRLAAGGVGRFGTPTEAGVP